ncbi:LytR family transcriptional regulator [Corynebacterium poyangense]|uniref:LytR family transcriptional regulator n=1 Tax=Corynebacterium poyangense TaxID=2684405 RepID=A0A7H0SRB0_9CORY|nr:LytR C-terminal domain-containing protein [Corynebacterium poyangense]MBZ8176517.1 LytR family transcriptional regulator [Corynebacterium poyangense]QNQ91085.1 LytR family transcriptional regulator [Corynebacterium poyangense]
MTQDQDNRSGRLPLRGLAMVFIAIAVILAMWGVYAFISRDKDDEAVSVSAPTTAVSSSSVAPPPTQPQSPSVATPAPAPSSEVASSAPAPAVAKLNVLNNSTEPKLAQDISEKLSREFPKGVVGNLPEEKRKLEKTTVFYHPGHEESARKLANQVGGEIAEYDPSFLPDNTRGADDLTLVLVNRPSL